MPELPEVETVRRGVQARFVGDCLDSLSVRGARTVRRHAPGLLAKLEGRALTGTRRHGKYLLLDWEGGECLVLHLRMSGQLLSADGSPAPLHTHAVFAFRREGELRFVDPRTFGELYLPSQLPAPVAGPGVRGSSVLAWPGQESLPPGMAHLGPDALEVTAWHLSRVGAGRRLAVKALLVDQAVVAGIGNIYSDEICWHARVHPATPCRQLTPARWARLAASTHEVLGAAIEARGSTLPDERYRDVDGRPGGYQHEHGAYGQSTCRRCGSSIRRVQSGSRLAYYCPRCQR